MHGNATGRVFFKALACCYPDAPLGDSRLLNTPFEVLHLVLFGLGGDLDSLMAMSQVSRYSRHLVHDFLTRTYSSLKERARLEGCEGGLLTYIDANPKFRQSLTRVQLFSVYFHAPPSTVMTGIFVQYFPSFGPANRPDSNLLDMAFNFHLYSMGKQHQLGLVVERLAPKSPKAVALRDYFRWGTITNSPLSMYVKLCVQRHVFRHPRSLLKALPLEQRFEYLHGMAMYCSVSRFRTVAVDILHEMSRVGAHCPHDESRMRMMSECINFALKLGSSRVNYSEFLPPCVAQLETLLNSRVNSVMQTVANGLPRGDELLMGMAPAYSCIMDVGNRIPLSNMAGMFDRLEGMLKMVASCWQSVPARTKLYLHFKGLMEVLISYIINTEQNPTMRLGAIAGCMNPLLRDDVFSYAGTCFISAGQSDNLRYLRPFLHNMLNCVRFDTNMRTYCAGR